MILISVSILQFNLSLALHRCPLLFIRSILIKRRRGKIKKIKEVQLEVVKRKGKKQHTVSRPEKHSFCWRHVAVKALTTDVTMIVARFFP